MNDSAIVSENEIKRSWLARLGRRLVLEQLTRIEQGRLLLKENGTEQYFGQETDRCPYTVRIDVHNPQMFADLAFGAGLGAGESYMAGHWQTDSLTRLVQIFVNNEKALAGMDGGLALLKAPARRLLHLINSNTRAGSRRNISAHYDLGNEFFKLFLDPSLMYSSAIFPDAQATLEQASNFKNDTLCRKLRLTPDDHLIEIGTGWGGFALHAAANYGCRVTTTTISREQFEEARQRVHAAGLQDRITLLMQDYRDLEGSYDKLVSIEMIEAVGHQFLDSYFEKCASLLRSEGLMAIQAITIPGSRYKKALKNVDFIKRYIFPGGFLPSLGAIGSAVDRKTDLEIAHIDDITAHYAETLRHWRKNFFRHIAEIRALGFPDQFLRMWEYYFCYCEGAFRERVIGNSQIVFTKPGYRGPVFGTDEAFTA